METVRSSTAGDALLMGSALHVVIQQREVARARGGCWFGRLSEASVILRQRARACAAALRARPAG
jgi:hypothetical protein